MDKNTKIAGVKTVGNWYTLRAKLEGNMGDPDLWENAYNNFFKLRLDTRYIKPIRLVMNGTLDPYTGEGFSVMALQCSIIEFLESFYQGIAYRYLKKGETLGLNEYNLSGEIFKSFLSKRPPFKDYFSVNDLAKDFYSCVRCGLLHEARTKGSWVIRVDSDKLFEKRGGKQVINRDKFQEGIEEYLLYYKKELLSSTERKEAFIRKMDSLCQP